MNILTTNGLVGRYVTDWAGPGTRSSKVAIRLGRAQLPGRHDDAHRIEAASDGEDGRGRGHRSRRQQPRQPRHRHRDRAAHTDGGEALRRGSTSAAGPRSSASAPRSSPRTRGAASCSWRARRCGPRWTTRASRRADVDGLVDLHDGHQPGDHRRPGLRHGRAVLLLPGPLRRRGGLRDGAAGGPRRRDRRGRGRRLLPRLQRALRAPFRVGVQHDRPVGAAERGALRLVLAVRPAHPGFLGGDGRAAATCTRTAPVRGLRARRRRRPAGMRPPTRRRTSTSRPITLADHAASRWIAEPLRLLDCCQEIRRRQALVVTSAERARSAAARPP